MAMATDTRLNLVEGRPALAFEDLCALIALTAHWQIEPVTISHLVRASMVDRIYDALFKLLENAKLSEKDLSVIEQALEEIHLLHQLPDIYAFERAVFSRKMAFARELPIDPTLSERASMLVSNPEGLLHTMKLNRTNKERT